MSSFTKLILCIKVIFMKSNKNNLIIYFEVMLFIATTCFLIFQRFDILSSIAILIICLITPIFLLEPYYALLSLIIIRSATDIYTENVFINIFNIVKLNFSSILGILVIVWAIYIILKEKINLKRIPLFWPWTLFIAMCSLSLIYSIDFTTSIRMLTKLFSVYFLYLISFFYFRLFENKKKYFIKAIFISSIIPILLGIYQIITSAGFIGQEGLSRVYGTFGHPNSFAFHLFFYFVVFFIVYKYGKNTKIKKPIIFYLCLLLILILFTLTRSVWIGIALFIIFLLFLYERKNFLKYLLWIFSLVILFFILINYTSLKYYDFNNIPFVARFNSSDTTTTLSSWDWRIKTWGEMSDYIYGSPVIGYGIDTYKTLREKQVYDVSESTYAHNDYLAMLIELGIIGLLLYLNLIIQTLYRIFQKYLLSKQLKYLISFVAILIIFLISSVDNILAATSLLWLMWIYIAYLLS